MNKVKIITDSTNDLSPEIIESLDIEVIPLFVNFGENSYLDGVDIDTPKLYKEVEARGQLPKTAAIDIITFINVFTKYVNEGYDVVYTGISKQMSRTFENAVLAANEFEKGRVYVVDSMNLSTGIGLLLLKACKDRDNGLSALDIATNMEKNTKLVLSQFAIETMEYLHKGGRCSGIARFVGTLLRIKPIIQVRNGRMSVMKKPVGKMKVALDAMIKQIVEDKERLDTDHILITHSMAYESCNYIKSKLEKEFVNVDIICTLAGCVISSHCGQGTIGILYMVKE
ncbi:MAG: DegV family protein [Anaeroplasma sp.]